MSSSEDEPLILPVDTSTGSSVEFFQFMAHAVASHAAASHAAEDTASSTSTSNRKYVERHREAGAETLMNDYFVDDPKYDCNTFRHRYFGETTTMEMQIQDESSLRPAVKVTLCLGSETRTVEACKGTLSEQLVFVKAESMSILKEFITKHNVPNDVPDEIENSSDDDADDDGAGSVVRSKKIRTENK